MIRRFYVHNFRCLENFELPIANRSSILLIGKNGAGKSTVGLAFEILQKIARGTSRVSELIKSKDFAQGHTEIPIRIEIEAKLEGVTYEYLIAFDFPPGFRELRVFEERFLVNGNLFFARELAQVHLARANQETDAKFRLDWHLAALPLVQEQTAKDPLFIFRQWLARALILRPIPSLITGDSEQETLQPNVQGTDFAAWFSGLIAHAPAAYGKIDHYLRELMPDFKSIENPLLGKDTRSIEVQFSNEFGNLKIALADLSDGEKCFMICAMVLAANETYGPLVCFWDEPDNFLAISEIGHFVMALRKAFQIGGQLITTSHNPEAIRRFSEENTLFLYRKSHFEPTNARPLNELDLNGDLVNGLIRGDIEP